MFCAIKVLLKSIFKTGGTLGMEAGKNSIAYRIWGLEHLHYGILCKAEYDLAILTADKLYEEGKVSRDEYLEMIRLACEALAGS